MYNIQLQTSAASARASLVMCTMSRKAEARPPSPSSCVPSSSPSGEQFGGVRALYDTQACALGGGPSLLGIFDELLTTEIKLVHYNFV